MGDNKKMVSRKIILCIYRMKEHCIGNCNSCDDESEYKPPTYLMMLPNGSKARWEHSWSYTKDLVMLRDKRRCVHCGAKASDVHHIIRREYGGSDHPRNLMSLCKNCHTALNSRKLDEKFKKILEKEKYEKYWGEILNGKRNVV